MIENLPSASAFRAALARPGVPLAVLFHSPQDANSARLAVAYESFARRRGPSISCAAMEFDDWSVIVEEYAIIALPMILVFSAGREVGRIVGVRSDAQLDVELSVTEIPCRVREPRRSPRSRS